MDEIAQLGVFRKYICYDTQHHTVQTQSTPGIQFITIYHVNLANLALFPAETLSDGSALSANLHDMQACGKDTKEKQTSVLWI